MIVVRMVARVAIAGALVLVGLMSLGAYLAGHVFPGELLAFFRLQYALAFLVLAAVAAAVRSPVLLVVALALLVLDAAAIAPALTAESRPDPQTTHLRLLVANVWYPNRDYAAMRRLVAREHPDVVGLVEFTRAYANGIQPALAGYRYRVLRPMVGAYGVGLYSRVPIRELRIFAPVGVWPAVASGVVTVGGRDVQLYVVHAPSPVGPHDSARQRAFMRALGDRARRAGGRALVCGDFNAPPWTPGFRDLLRHGRLERADPWRPWQGTWLRLPQPLRVPIDTCAAGQDIAVAVRTGPPIGSDHRPILVRVG